jgi:hypothetical protein
VSFSGTPKGISGRWVETRVSLLKQPLDLHDPGRGFVFVAKAGDRPELAACCRHLDIDGAIALRQYLKCCDCHTRQYVDPASRRNIFNSLAE